MLNVIIPIFEKGRHPLFSTPFSLAKWPDISTSIVIS